MNLPNETGNSETRNSTPQIFGATKERTMKRLALLLVSLGVFFVAVSAQAQSTADAAGVPRVINFSGMVAGEAARTGGALITVSVYAEQSGGAPLWSEQQTVTLDSAGHYSVLLGSLTQGGIPSDVFVSGAARWVGVSVNSDVEGARFMLISVPYALKAADADTVGGKAPSDFVLASNLSEKVKDVMTTTSSSAETTTSAVTPV